MKLVQAGKCYKYKIHPNRWSTDANWTYIRIKSRRKIDKHKYEYEIEELKSKYILKGVTKLQYELSTRVVTMSFINKITGIASDNSRNEVENVNSDEWTSIITKILLTS